MRQTIHVLDAKQGIGKKSGKAWYQVMVKIEDTVIRLFVRDEAVYRKLEDSRNEECDVELKIGSDRELNPRVDIESVLD